MRFVHVVVATPAPGVDVKPETGVYDRDVYDPAEAVRHFLEKLSKQWRRDTKLEAFTPQVIKGMYNIQVARNVRIVR